jgi:hypothetical protein
VEDDEEDDDIDILYWFIIGGSICLSLIQIAFYIVHEIKFCPMCM